MSMSIHSWYPKNQKWGYCCHGVTVLGWSSVSWKDYELMVFLWGDCFYLCQQKGHAGNRWLSFGTEWLQMTVPFPRWAPRELKPTWLWAVAQWLPKCPTQPALSLCSGVFRAETGFLNGRLEIIHNLKGKEENTSTAKVRLERISCLLCFLSYLCKRNSW